MKSKLTVTIQIPRWRMVIARNAAKAAGLVIGGCLAVVNGMTRFVARGMTVR